MCVKFPWYPQSQYIRDMGLAGGMIWALDLDDFNNRCGQGAHPLLNTIKSVLGLPKGPDVNPMIHVTRSRKCFNSAIGAIKAEVVHHPPIQEAHNLPMIPGVRPPPGIPVCAKKCWDPNNGVVVMEVTHYPPGRSGPSLPMVERVQPKVGMRRPSGMEECKCWDPNKSVIRTNVVHHPPIQPEHFLPEVRPPPGVEVCSSAPGTVSPPGTSSGSACWNPHERMGTSSIANHPPIQPDQFLPEVPGVRPPVCPPGTQDHPPPAGELYAIVLFTFLFTGSGDKRDFFYT